MSVSTETTPLPLEVRIGLDVIARTMLVDDGVLRATVIGDPALIESLSNYTTLYPSSDRLITLWAPKKVIADSVAANRPAEILEVTSGPLDSILAPLRSGAPTFIEGTASGSPDWHALGYDAATLCGIQGLAAVLWATAERVVRRLGRPDLADRCRVAMLRTIVSSRPVHLGTIRVRRLRRRRNGFA